MIIKHVSIKNFGSIQNAEVNLQNKGLVLTEGVNLDSSNGAAQSNGGGKSTWLNAVVYALYGQTTDGRSNDILVNRDIGKNMEVVLDFEQAGVDYTVTRGRKKNVLTLIQGDNNLTGATIKDTQAKLEEILGIPFDLFRSTVFFDGATAEGFPEKTDKNKKQFLETIIDLEPYRKANELTKVEIKEQEDKVNQLKGKKDSLVEMRIGTQEVHENQNKVLETYKNGVVMAEKSYNAILEDFNNYTTNYVEEHEKLSRDITEASEAISPVVEVEMIDLTSLRTDVAMKGNEVTRIKQEMSIQTNKLNSATAQIGQQKQVIRDYMEIANSSFSKDNMKSAFDAGTINDIVAYESIKSDSLDRERAAAMMNELKAAMDNKVAIEQRLSTLPPELEAAERTLTQAQESLSENEVVLKKQREQERAMNQSVFAAQKLLNEKQQELTNLERERVTKENAVKTAENDLKMKRNQVKQHEETAATQAHHDFDKLIGEVDAELVAVVNHLTELEAAKTAFSDSGIISHVISTVAPALTSATNKYLSQLTGGVIQVEFTTLKKNANGDTSEKLDVLVFVNGEESDYKSLSRGEKRRTDIAISLALAEVAASNSTTTTNVMFMDEVFESLDANGAETVVTMLQEKVDNPDDAVDTIFVVSHQEELKSLFSSSLVVTKKDGNSTIKEI